jgi:hypothetical protein
MVCIQYKCGRKYVGEKVPSVTRCRLAYRICSIEDFPVSTPHLARYRAPNHAHADNLTPDLCAKKNTVEGRHAKEHLGMCQDESLIEAALL